VVAPILGSFALTHLLGTGSMGVAYVAERLGTGLVRKRVCLKILLPQDHDDPKWVERFQSEGRLLGELIHPNVVALHDFGESDGKWWMSLELVEGIDLRQLMAQLSAAGQRLPPQVAVWIATEVAEALAYAHAARFSGGAAMVHRDVTPSNILLSRDGAVKLSDFGIAKVQRREEKTRTAALKGKEQYQAPEQAVGDPVDARADLFSLGVVLFQLLSGGAGPYDGATSVAAAINAVHGTRTRSLATEAPGLPASLVAIVEQLTESRREARQASAVELLSQLDALGVWVSARRSLAGIVRAACVQRGELPRAVWPSEGPLLRVALSDAGNVVANAEIEPGQTPGMERALLWRKPGAGLVVGERRSEAELLALLGPPDKTVMLMVAMAMARGEFPM
jgi:serine/threonine protein kinase